MATRVDERQILWIDLDRRAGPDLEAAAAAVGMEDTLLERLREAPTRADLTQFHDHVHLAVQAMEGSGNATDVMATAPTVHPLDIVSGRDWVVTIHDGPLRALARFEAGSEGETRFGALDAAGFVAAIADEVLAGYFDLVEGIEREIDRLDERALRGRPKDEILVQIVKVRQRIGFIRRTLAPHRTAFAALARPEMDLHDELGRPWPGLTERLVQALEAVENLRELLLGTIEIHMGRSAQDANDVMKLLTLLSAVLLPAVVLAGVMGMNFQLPFFQNADNFWLVIGAMAVFAGAMLATARWRHWL
jgi:magnesium transporter